VTDSNKKRMAGQLPLALLLKTTGVPISLLLKNCLSSLLSIN